MSPIFPRPRRTRISWPVVLIAFLAGVLLDRWLAVYQPLSLGATFKPFWEAWHLVEDHYVDREAIQPTRMMHGSIAGMLASLGDVGHTTFLAPGELKQLAEQLAGRLEGIGAGMTVRDHRPTVLYTLPGSPARAAGLRPGDALLRVDDKDVSNLPLEQVVRLVRGPPGTSVRLHVQRPGSAEPLDLTITRARVEVPDVTWRMLPGQPVAHIAIREFGEHTHDELKKVLDEADRSGAEGLLLDLRGDPGGLKAQAVGVAGEFLAGGVVFIEVDARGRRHEETVAPGDQVTTLPVVALIDQGTASSAEIVAGALQDHGRAQLVGTRTFGTGTVLEPFPLSDGSAILLAVAKWLTPNGREIWHRGITPDVEVELPPGATALLPEVATATEPVTSAGTSDKQLLKALEVLRKKLP